MIEQPSLFLDEKNTEIENLRKKYLVMINITLPALAIKHHWRIKNNHCFARIILDNLFGDCWYHVLEKSKNPAYLRLTEHQLKTALKIGNSLPENLHEMNVKSLTWRAKA